MTILSLFPLCSGVVLHVFGGSEITVGHVVYFFGDGFQLMSKERDIKRFLCLWLLGIITEDSLQQSCEQFKWRTNHWWFQCAVIINGIFAWKQADIWKGSRVLNCIIWFHMNAAWESFVVWPWVWLLEFPNKENFLLLEIVQVDSSNFHLQWL